MTDNELPLYEPLESVTPCPFCKSSAVVLAKGRAKEERFIVFCQDCGAKGPPAQRKTHAVMLWNTRPTPPQEHPEPLSATP